MVPLNGKLLLFGGINNQTAAQYDTKTGTWCTLNLPTWDHHYGALAGLGKKLYLMGGYGRNEIEEYNTDTGEWTVQDTKLPKTLTYLRALAFNI